MESFPFTDEEWDTVKEAARLVTNAGLAGDSVSHAAHLVGLLRVLADLRSRYGAHPVLLETEADYTDDPAARVALYERAKQAAQTGGLVTYSIRMALAQVLSGLGHPQRAMQELMACRYEVMTHGDDWERNDWQSLHAECVNQIEGGD